MTGPAKFSPIPRAHGPEYLARCAPVGGYWWLVVLDRLWESVDGKSSDVPAAGGALPEDEATRKHLGDVLAGLGFGASPDVTWTADPDGSGAWIMPVEKVTPRRT